MSKAEEEEQARLERARAIGLFRYMLIREAADPALSTRQRGAMVREIAAREHEGPSGAPVRVTRRTVESGLRAWRRGRTRSGPATHCTRSGWTAARPTFSRSWTIIHGR